MELWYNQKDEQVARKILNQWIKEDLIALVPGASCPSKEWKVENYITMLDKLLSIGKSKFIILGGAKEVNLGETIINYIQSKSPDRVLNLINKTTLREASAILSKCRLYIGNDTGLMHMAAAVGNLILSPNKHPSGAEFVDKISPQRFGPYGVPNIVLQPHYPLDKCSKTHGCVATNSHCINQVTVDQMIEAFFKLSSVTITNSHSCRQGRQTV